MTGIYQAKTIASLSEISEDEWNACCYTQQTRHNPFLSHQFLYALEESGCATRETGWQAQHILIHKGNKLVGVMPLYLKSHSYGEYVFDHAWADAYQHAFRNTGRNTGQNIGQNTGENYYPKLQSAVPFSPVTAPKLMVRPSEILAQNTREIQEKMLMAALSLVKEYQLSSLHVTFAEKAEWNLMAEHGFLKRLDQQFHWHNDGYGSFDDFLMALSSRKRKNIRKERKQAVIKNVDIEILSGKDITEEHWDHYFSFYLETGQRKWGQPYLNRRFFSLLGEKISEKIVLIMCKREDKYIAGALNMLSDDTLYGRYWGAIEDHKYLHFEVCYYQAIEYAIRHGLKKVEAGAQGEHKLARGYRPAATYSAHWISNPQFRKAVADYLVREREVVKQNQKILMDFAPFKKGNIQS
ncbi:MAG: GNAT family N-acetyltransferase [Alphaproteobacteria bacterium]|nr:MAG: GNAT family N-acetyltransferase [Alphaproteobacteria bacterium]